MVQHYGSLGVQSRKTLKNAPGQLERPSWGSERAWAPEEEEEEEEEDGESGRSYVITYAPHFNFALLDPSEFHGLIQTFAASLSLQAELTVAETYPFVSKSYAGASKGGLYSLDST